MSRKTEKIRELVRIGISETLETRAIDGGQRTRRVYSVRTSFFARWLLLIIAAACLLLGASGLTGFKTILQKAL